MGNEEKDNLKALLKYWISHNQDHDAEFKEWAGEAKVMSKVEVDREIQQQPSPSQHGKFDII